MEKDPTGKVVELFDPPFRKCPLCGVFAICQLPPKLRAQQTDGTNVVCHPAHGGCNHGFELEGLNGPPFPNTSAN